MTERRKLRSLGRRYTDRKLPRHLRDFWMLAITVVLFFAGQSALDASHHADRAVQQVQQSRRVTCAVVSAISLEGRKVISTSEAPGSDSRFERFLEAHGYPPRSVRRRAAKAAGQRYVRDISERVHKLVGHVGDGLVRRDGTIDCQRLQALARRPKGG